MKTFILGPTRTFVIGAATSAALAALVVACTDETSIDPPGSTDELDAGPDATVNLPPDTNGDGGGDADADAGRTPRDPFDPADEPVVCATGASSCAVQLVAGRYHFCARMSDGAVRCWGDTRSGVTGKTVLPDGGAAPPVRTIEDLAGVTQISSRGRTNCAVLDDGTAKCWGSNQNGQLALSGETPTSDFADHPVPSVVSAKESIARIDVGDRVVCAVLQSGKVSCWGENYSKQITSATAAVAVPTEIATGSFDLARFAIGSGTTLGITADGKVASWGALNGPQGVLAGRLASLSPDERPVLVEHLENVTSFAVSNTLDRNNEGALGKVTPPKAPPGGAPPHAHACVIAGGEVYCWGRSDFGALCTGLFDVERRPAHAPISGKAWPQQLALGDELTCARMTDGSVHCCGVDHRGRLGIGFSTLFVKVDAFKGHAVQIATSHRAICALLKDGGVECWGNNEYGELGQGTSDKDEHPTPVKVAF